MTELCSLDASTALGLFRSREVSPVELMHAVIERTALVIGTINCFTETLFEEALLAAASAESHYRSEAHHRSDVGLPALLGLPVATKEKHAIAGRSLSHGLIALSGEVATSDHPVVERIRAAGGIIHARTTTPEFSCATTTHSRLWGVTRNPWNLAASPGGSSGGAGAALAAGMTTLATASDIAGSTRIPAAFTGTVGFKAPYGRIPGLPPLSMDHYRGDGPMARTVADTALLANVLAGRHRLDHASLPASAPLPTSFAPVAGTRIALCVKLGNYPVTAEIEANTRAVAAALTAAGAVVEEVELPWTTQSISETTLAHFGLLLGPELARLTVGGENLLSDYSRRFLIDVAAAISRLGPLGTAAAEAQLQGELTAAMTGFDALLCPTSAVSSLAADDEYLNGIDVGDVHLEHYWEAHMTVPFNVNNRCPVLAVPSGMAANGCPTGVQIVGHPFDDETVFRIGAAIEQSRPWSGRSPLIGARTTAL